MPYTKDELKSNEYYQVLTREDEAKYSEMVQSRIQSGNISDGTLRDPVSGNILLFERIIPGQGTDGTSYVTGDFHTIEYEDGYFDYEETEELNNILDREFTEF
jgi:hypothetical protein